MLTKFQMQPDSFNMGDYSAEIFTDRATKDKVRKHITNPADIISEEDLINIKTKMTVATFQEERRAARESGIDIPNDGL